MKKAWIESAFGDDPIATASSNKPTRPARKTATTSSTTETKKKSTQSSSNSTKLTPLINKLINNFNNHPITANHSALSKKQIETKCPLTEKYQPVKRADLVVHKSKIEQLSSLIDQITSKNTGSILIVEGPPGSGKNATLNVLCKEKNIDMITWTQPSMSLTKIENNETDRSYHADYQVYESQAKLFDQFLFKSSRYISDQIFCTEQRTKKLLFIKDIPLFAYREPLNFQKQLRQFIKYSKYSLVICLTTSPVQSNETNPIKVLTLELRKELNMQEVTFNPLAVSYMNKQVERIAQLENLSFLDSNSINEICQSSDGDLRHAINILELATVRTKPRSAIGSTTAAKKRKLNTQKTKENISEPSSALIQKKDANFTIFRGLGKVLHRKNDPDELNIETENKLPKHLKNKYFRKPLFYSPEEIISKLPISEEITTMYLHQNYLELYGIKSGSLDVDAQLNALSKITDNFICTDLMHNKLSIIDQSSSVYNTKHKEMPVLLSVRSVLFYTYLKEEDKSTASTNNSNKSLWMPLHKPYTYKCNELKKQRFQAAQRCLFRDGNTQLASYLIEMQSEFFTTILPYANLKNMYRELAAKYTKGKMFRLTKAAISSASENDPGFFMDDEEEQKENDLNSKYQLPLNSNSLNQENSSKLYEYDENANIQQIFDF